MKKLIKVIIIMMILTAIILQSVAVVYAETAPYSNYIYSSWSLVLNAPPAYQPAQLINPVNIEGVGGLLNPADFFINKTLEQIYIVDSGNNRVIILDTDYNLVKVIDTFTYGGEEHTFANPQGMFVTEEGFMYICDTDNHRIVHMTPEYRVVRVIGTPVSELLDSNFIYYPLKLVVDKPGRMYIIAKNVNQGLIELDAEGDFRAFTGAAKVRVNWTELFWRTFATDEQKKRMAKFAPSEYNNISIDESDFLYVTTSALNQYDVHSHVATGSTDDRYAPIRKLNSSGTDILRRTGWHSPGGDIVVQWSGQSDQVGMSTIEDVAIQDNGIYSILDGKKGRIFTYDVNGELLYIFGGFGTRFGNFRDPVAIDTLGDRLLVLDGKAGTITAFEQTEYGKLINLATAYKYQGNYDEAGATWHEVLNYNSNMEMAYLGIGEIQLRMNEYTQAMESFKLGDSPTLYSKAYKLYRRIVIEKYFTTFMIVVLIIVAVIFVYVKFIRRRKKPIEQQIVDTEV